MSDVDPIRAYAELHERAGAAKGKLAGITATVRRAEEVLRRWPDQFRFVEPSADGRTTVAGGVPEPWPSQRDIETALHDWHEADARLKAAWLALSAPDRQLLTARAPTGPL